MKVQFSTTVRKATEVAELIHLDVRRLLRFSLRKSARFMLMLWVTTRGGLDNCAETQV